MLARPHLAFWAKLGSATWPEQYHPVVCHLIDVAAVVWNLWHIVFRPQLRQWLAARLGLEEDECARWLTFWSGAHDIGKVAACFQDRNDIRTTQLRKWLEGNGFLIRGGDWPHGTISAAVLADLLARPAGWPPLTESFADRVAVAVGGHHGLFPPNWREVKELLASVDWDRPWHAARQEILRCLAQLIGVEGKMPEQRDSADQSIFMVLAGLTSVADWIGSNQQFFPPTGNPEVAAGQLDIEDYFQQALPRARDALEQLGWLDRGAPAAARTFQDLFAGILPGKPRPLQEVVAAIADELTDPALVLIEAPMGEGKTEAAWYVTHRWDQCNGQGAYVALPTMATSNQMFDRVVQFLQRNPGKSNIQLLHAKAQLNDCFNDRLRLAYIYDTSDDDKKERPSAVVAEGWFAANKKHGLLAPFGVGTIDQSLLAVLQTKHVFVRLFGLAGKCVILDEVHAYDAYMSTLLERLLQWLAALGCPVVLLSATLPKEKRQKLLQAYALGRAELDYADRAYPRVTVLRPGASCPIEVKHVEADPARSRTIALSWKRSENLADEIKTVLADGGCAAVIRKTVGLAQETYVELKKALADSDIEVEWLFHARFPFGRRQQIEERILRRYSKGRDGKPENPDRPKKAVLVATQVIEQSLDLDFDLLVTDVAPVDLVLQRAGRLWRHERSQRGVKEPMLWLLQPERAADGVPAFGPSEKVYARYILLLSFLCLQGREQVCLPGDLATMIERVYGADVPIAPDAFWQEALDSSQEELAETRKKQCLGARNLAIRQPDDESVLEQQSLQLEEDNPEAHERIRAATRDTQPTVQLIIVYRLLGGDALEPDGKCPVRLAQKPTRAQTADYLANEVSISHPGCVAFYVRKDPEKAWRENGLLRYHRAVIVGPDGTSLADEFPLRVDPELGIVFRRKQDQGD
jgi:CRISPR-associated endonuclease/helicase Cas3